MLEQEIASIIMFILRTAGNPAAYYWNIPESFQVPSIFFPTPEISTSGDTSETFKADYFYSVKFFHNTTQAAYALALKSLIAIRSSRNLIPLISEDGELTPETVRISDPELRQSDDGAVLLLFTWRNRLPYSRPGTEKMQQYEATMYLKWLPESGRSLSAQQAESLESSLPEQQ